MDIIIIMLLLIVLVVVYYSSQIKPKEDRPLTTEEYIQYLRQEQTKIDLEQDIALKKMQLLRAKEDFIEHGYLTPSVERSIELNTLPSMARTSYKRLNHAN